ncbi:hypothetical protein [Roseomonas sp. BN140053]|uniref:hypothetical protein n=1 Tax=Roseomonas sp. BN140053 TaxID=3391898 RepID=UPI0039E814CD
MLDEPEDLTPTPTQAENDRAKLAGRDPAAAMEPPKADQDKPKAETGAKASREAKAEGGAKYETR